MEKGTVLVRLGKTVYLKCGNFLWRVPVERVIPDHDNEEVAEQSFLDPDEVEDAPIEEIPVKDLDNDLEIVAENEN